jgi:hypothetical protein
MDICYGCLSPSRCEFGGLFVLGRVKWRLRWLLAWSRGWHPGWRSRTRQTRTRSGYQGWLQTRTRRWVFGRRKEGSELGLEDGNKEGCTEGKTDGCKLGIEDGCPDGDAEGGKLGPAEGSNWGLLRASTTVAYWHCRRPFGWRRRGFGTGC